MHAILYAHCLGGLIGTFTSKQGGLYRCVSCTLVEVDENIAVRVLIFTFAARHFEPM